MNKNFIGKIFIAFTLAEMLVILTVFSIIAASTLPIMTAPQKVGNTNNSITGESSEIIELWTKTGGGIIVSENPSIYYAPDTAFLDSTVAIGTGDRWPTGTPTGPQPRLLINKNMNNSIMDSSHIFFSANAQSDDGGVLVYPAGRIAFMNNCIAMGYNALWDTTGGYDNRIGDYNIAIGSNAMLRSANLSVSANDKYNIAIGNGAFSGGVGGYNISLGVGSAKKLNGSHNITVGRYANNNLYGSNISNYSTIIGNYAGFTYIVNNVPRTHSYSIMVGDRAGSYTRGTYSSIFLGYSAGSMLVNGNYNSIAIGTYAGAKFIPDSVSNIHIGKFAGFGTNYVNDNGGFTGGDVPYTNTGLFNSIFIGTYAGAGLNYTGNIRNIIGIGKYVLYGSKSINNDTIAIGLYAQYNANQKTPSTGAPVIIGNYAHAGNSSSPAAVVIGNYAGRDGNMNALNSIFIGNYAGYGSGNRELINNICIGQYACANVATAYNTIRIGHFDKIAKNNSLGRYASYIGSWIPEGGTNSQYAWWNNTELYPTLLISTSGGSTFSDTSIMLYSSLIFARNSMFTVFSDKRLKENIKESKYSLNDLRKINVYEYNFKDDKSKDLQIGVIAQELKKIIPQAVTTNPFNGYLAVDTSWVMYTVVNSVKELDLKVQKISASLNSYAKEFVSLATRVEKLEKEVLMLERENKYLTSQVNAEYKKVKTKGK